MLSLRVTLMSVAKRRRRTMSLDEWISRFDNEEADKLTQNEQLEIKSMLIELRERRFAAAKYFGISIDEFENRG
jgi:hypothetical protein